MRRERIPLRRDVVTTETVRVGSLAARVADAEAEMLAAETQLEAMLDSLYGDWSAWESGLGALDVYDAADSPAAAAALFRAGFLSVRTHDHDKTKFSKCHCATRRDPLI